MMTKRNRWLALALCIGALIVAVFMLSRPPVVPVSNAVSLSFLGYTNASNSSLPFALFSVSNQAPYTIGWRDLLVEVEGDSNLRARVVNGTLPGFKIEPSLEAGHFILIAVGEPSDLDETGRWRFNMTFSPYTTRDRWWHFSRRHKSAAKAAHVLGFNDRSPLGQSNRVTISTVWLTK